MIHIYCPYEVEWGVRVDRAECLRAECLRNRQCLRYQDARGLPAPHRVISAPASHKEEPAHG